LIIEIKTVDGKNNEMAVMANDIAAEITLKEFRQLFLIILYH
jgi:hypothetical protein